ncbi:MAG: hypothetical protein A2506_11380 [Elusimicrobia bacterium RIFOXYD12_FULL_66_9]|nr:MAG: hypothetical protein A2506_11380 [Elusimicrobia bacterium RIFOXYD12_FULL_66_9]
MLASSLSLLLAAAAAAADLSAWRWRQDFPVTGGAQTVVALDGPVYDGAKEDLSDLRVFGPGGEEIPYALEADVSRIEDARVPARILNLVRLPDGATRFELDLGEHPAPHSYLFLDISPENRNYRAAVTLEAAHPDGGWAVLKDGINILDFSQDFHLRYSELYYPESDFRRLRVTLREKDGAPMKVDGAWVRRHAHRPGMELMTTFTTAKSSSATSEIRDLDFGYDKTPVHRVAFSVSTPEFKRRVVVSVPGPDGTWRSVGESVIYRYASGRFSGSNLVASFPEVRARRLRVEVFHYDDRPLAVKSITAFGYVRRLCLKDPKPDAYVLRYGNPAAAAPRYDLAALSAYLDKSAAAESKLGERREDSAYRAPSRPWNEEHPWALRAALAAALLGLAAIVLRQWRSIAL